MKEWDKMKFSDYRDIRRTPLNDKWGRKLCSQNLITAGSCKTGEEIETKNDNDEVGTVVDKGSAGITKGD